MTLPHRMLRSLLVLLRFFTGVLLTQFLMGAVLLAGWGQEVARRAAMCRWKRAAAMDCPAYCTRWPTFLMSEEPPLSNKGLVARSARRLLGGAWSNLAAGLICLLGTYALTLPGMALWTFSWRYGWDNSFNKGYEQAYIGPTLGIIGILLFLLAMLYVPLAQVQVAVTGRLATFFRWRIIAAVFMGNLTGVQMLTAAYVLAAIPINLLLAGVLFRFNDTIDSPTLTDAELREKLEHYFLFAGVIGLPLFACLRALAGRVYAQGFVGAVRSGGMQPDIVAGIPQLETVYNLSSTLASKRTWINFKRAISAALIAVMLLLWFLFVAQIYVRQFLNYVPMQGWLNQPLVHAPWLSHLPAHLDP